MEISEFLVQLRSSRGITQTDLAKKLGLSRPAVSKWESGDTSNLKLHNLRALCRLYGITADQLLACDPTILRPQYQQSTGSALVVSANEPPHPGSVFQMRSSRDRYIHDILAHLSRTDDVGLAVVLDKARDIAKERPRQTQGNAT